MHKKHLLTVLLVLALAGLASIVICGADTNSSEILQLLSSHAERLKLKAVELQSISRGEIIIHDLPASHGREMAGFGAMLVEAEPSCFVEAFRTLSVFKQSKNVIACGLFENDPALSNLGELTFKEKDLLELMRARANDSDVKLSGPDIARIQAVAGPNPRFSGKLVEKLTDEYKRILLEKVKAYAALGGQSLGTYADRGEQVNANEAMTRMLRYQTSYAKYGELFYTLLADHPRVNDKRAESFYYWAVQKFAQLKPVITLVHVMILQEEGRVLIASKQIYSSHYTEAGLGIAELTPLIDREGKIHTLMAYSIRLQVDMLGGATGFLKKRMAQPRVLETLKESLTGLRHDLESAHNVVSK